MSTHEQTRLRTTALAGWLATLTVATGASVGVFAWLRSRDKRAWQQLADNDARLAHALWKLGGRRGPKPSRAGHP